MKIGLVGGSFNPPHKGHIHISLESQKRAKLDQIWWLPTKQNPFKKERTNFEEKILSCREITKKHGKITVKNYERDIKSSYTIDLLNRLVKKYPQHQFFWIMGADSIIHFHQWKKWQEIIKLTPLIVCDRGEFLYKAVKSKAFSYAKKLNRVNFLRIKKCDISSSKIRLKE